MGSVRQVYLQTRKVPDLAWNYYVCRPIAAVLVHAVRDRRITPNQITLLAVLVCLVAVGLFIGAPGHLGVVLAVVVFEVSYILDCADGMLARLRNVQSPQGHLLDFLMDEIKAFLVLGAVAIRLYLDRGTEVFLLLGIVGLVALASGIALTTFVRRPEVAGPPESQGGAARGPKSLIGRVVAWLEHGAKFLIHYPSYIWLAAVVGRLEIYLYPYLAVNVAYAARTWLQVALRFGRR